MIAPDIHAQLNAAKKTKTFEEGVAAMNALVKYPCPIPKRSVWRLGMRPPRHIWRDHTAMLNTMTYTTLDRCARCGLFVLGSGL